MLYAREAVSDLEVLKVTCPGVVDHTRVLADPAAIEFYFLSILLSYHVGQLCMVRKVANETITMPIS